MILIFNNILEQKNPPDIYILCMSGGLYACPHLFFVPAFYIISSIWLIISYKGCFIFTLVPLLFSLNHESFINENS